MHHALAFCTHSHQSLHCQTLLAYSWVLWFPKTHPISLRSAHERGCWVPICSYKGTLQTAVKWVHPNWECLTLKHLNQLLNKRVHPFPPLVTQPILYSPQPTPLLLPSLWNHMEEIHLWYLVVRLVSATRSK